MSILQYGNTFKKPDVENPNLDDGIDGVHLAKAEDGKGVECLGFCVGGWVTWTILTVVGMVVIFCRSVHAPMAVRVLAGLGLAVAFVGYAAWIGWCMGVIEERLR